MVENQNFGQAIEALKQGNTVLGAVFLTNSNRMTIYETNLLHKKAETKKDGVYSFRGNLWAVKNGKFVAFIDNRGQVLQRFGAFNTQIGDLSTIERWDWKKELVEWLRSQ